MTSLLAGSIARQGLTVVSGMAYGVDTASHRAALEAGGRTLAILGQGLGTPVYPGKNNELARSVVELGHGAVVSPFPMMTKPSAGLFPLRNEIIAGLTLGTLVIEARLESGSLVTARQATANNRTVMACPGDTIRSNARGSNRLIAEGACLVQTLEISSGFFVRKSDTRCLNLVSI